ncbi:hypothetical protein [Acidiphilium sp.]|uniref:hypothetical protein n=1 Tax=Acidiphilium sp. TaxID=527 RepID=UPI00258980A7|nr:hypothetical protein [Acidiphilium sp.]
MSTRISPPVRSVARALQCAGVRGDPLTETPPPARVIGIDDFSWRRGDSDGGIVVDLEVVRSSTC